MVQMRVEKDEREDDEEEEEEEEHHDVKKCCQVIVCEDAVCGLIFFVRWWNE